MLNKMYILLINKMFLDRFELPYNYDTASEYRFNNVISTLDTKFWIMWKLRTPLGEFFFHKMTNVVFNDKFELVGRFIKDKVVLLDDLDNAKEIENWFHKCRAAPLSNRDIYVYDLDI